MAYSMLSTVGLTTGEPGLAGIGFTLTLEDGTVYEGGSYIGETTGMVAEYNALVWGLENAKAAGVMEIEVAVDDESLANQVQGFERVGSEGLKPLFAQVIVLLASFSGFVFEVAQDAVGDRAVALARKAMEERETIGDFLRRPTHKQSLFNVSAVDGEVEVIEERSETILSTDERRSVFPETPYEPDATVTSHAGEGGPFPRNVPGKEGPRSGEGDDASGGDGSPYAPADATPRTGGPHATSPGIDLMTSSILKGAAHPAPSSGTAPSSQDVPAIEPPQKTALVGVTGCIAAYKACEVVRGLQKAGYRVKVMMTPNATRFVGPSTFKALTQEPVAVSMFDAASDPVYHVSLAKEADLMVIAPCTANVMAKIASGMADDLLTTTVLAARCPVLIAPAMNTVMWEASATRDNLRTLERRGFRITRPVEGHLACGDEGAGKLADVSDIVDDAVQLLRGDNDLEGLKVLVTAGPTFEPIDPVRFIGNRSSGRMGYAVATEAARRGAHVTLVTGPTTLSDPHGAEVVRVTTAKEMLYACRRHFHGCALAVFAAAVCDFAPTHVAPQKIKKSAGGLERIELEENPDILESLAADKGGTYVVGFAAETEDVLRHAQEKLLAKHANMIVANDVSGDLGFDTADDHVWFVTLEGIEELPVMPKSEIATRILDSYLERSK